MKRRISIIGGGITGLTTAIALGQKGIPSTIYEQAASLEEVGAGIWLQPNAIHVLDTLGLKPKIEKAGALIDKMEITDPSFKPHKTIPSSIATDAHGNKTIGIHRAKLQKILYAKAKEYANIHFGKKYINHTETKGNIEIQFEDGKETTDILLGADGINSKVRNSFYPNAKTRNAEQMCWRGIANLELPEQLKNKGKEAWGKNVRFGFSEIDSQNNVYWFAVLKKQAQIPSTDELPSFFSNFNPIASQLIRATENIHMAELGDLKRLANWHKEMVCLLGDAAHATTPNMGQGAGQGIEDAYYFAHFISSHDDPKNAFKLFEKSRRKKVDYIVNNSWTFGKLAHIPIGRFLLTSMMKITPQKIIQKQMSRVYSVEI